MSSEVSTLALCTAIYPGVEMFLPDWYRSVREQTDQDFELWIGLDQIEIEAAKAAMGGDPDAIWVPGLPSDTPAEIRQRVLARIVHRCDAVVLVDSDDALHPSRVASARAMLRASDLVGCALRMVDEEGRDMGATLAPPPGADPTDVLPRHNVFGLSNTAMRTSVLRWCLPIPAAVALVDWFLVTRAWLLGARMAFDNKVGMDYRQHGANMARVIPPFDGAQVALDTQRILLHLRIVRSSPLNGILVERLAELEAVAADIERFHAAVVLEPESLGRYVEALNALRIAPLWGACVAHPSLSHMWMPGKETP